VELSPYLSTSHRVWAGKQQAFITLSKSLKAKMNSQGMEME